MADLAALPDELLIYIGEYLDRPDLASFCVTSKRFNHFLTVMLYRAIRVHWKPRATSPRIALLLRSLIRRPSLSSYVETLEFSAIADAKTIALQGRDSSRDYGLSRSAWSDVPRGRASFSHEDWQLALDMVDDLRPSPDHQANCRSSFNRGDVGLIVFLILSKCHLLRSLSIRANFHLSNYIATSLQLPVCGNGFPKLQRIAINPILLSDELRIHHGFQHTISLFMLPVLEYLAVAFPAGYSFWPGAPPVSPLKVLVLHQCQISEKQLGVLLAATPHLQYFEYDYRYKSHHTSPRLRFDREILNCARLDSSLRHVKGSLKKLVIFAQVETSWNPKVKCATVPLKSLSEFHKLTSLRLPYAFILGASPDDVDVANICDALPPRLEDLTFTEDFCDIWQSKWSDADLVHAFQVTIPHLAGNRLRPGRPPRFKFLWRHYRTSAALRGADPRVWSALDAPCQEAGVLLQFVKDRGDL